MKKWATVFFALAFLAGCGSLRINPKGCRGNALWGANPLSTREITKEEREEEKIVDLHSKEEYAVFSNTDISLKDLLEEHGLSCEDVKKVRVLIKTSWFFKREVVLKVVKNE